MAEKLRERIKEADMLLIGVGDEFSEKKASREKVLSAYHTLQELVKGKPWFLITLNTDDLVYESGMSEFFIVAPCGSDKTGNVVTNPDYDETCYLEQWKCYTNYLTATLGKKLLILELGVGLSYPGVIRMPFEKTVQYNTNASMIRVHSKLAFAPWEIIDRCITISQQPIAFLDEQSKLSDKIEQN